MPENTKQSDEEVVVLKDPVLSAVLAWLVPGLGHWHQGRRGKAVLFFFCIISTFVFGIYLGGNREVGWGRTVYFSWRDNDRRLAYVCQIGAGLVALPAIIQANLMASQQRVWWKGFMAPPRPSSDPGLELLQRQGADPKMREVVLRAFPNLDQPTISELHHKLARYFELGTVFTMIGGLLNLLAIYDAWGGPVFSSSSKKEEPAPAEETGAGLNACV